MLPVTNEQIISLLGKVAFFHKFTREELNYFASMDCTVYRFKDRDNIIRQGEEEFALYILLQGSVRVTKDIPRTGNRRPKEVFLTKLKPGAVFGEISLLSKRPRATSAFSEGDTIVAKLDGKHLEEMDPVVANKINRQLINLLVARLEDMNNQMMQFTQ